MSDEDASAAVPATEIAKLLFSNEQENGVFIRHYEDVRFKITQVTVTLAGLLIGATRFSPVRTALATNIPISLFIIILGTIGILISAKYSERADRHATISRAYRREASAIVGKFQDIEFEKIHQQAAWSPSFARTPTSPRKRGEVRGPLPCINSLRSNYPPAHTSST
jgi:hypothetical protein